MKPIREIWPQSIWGPFADWQAVLGYPVGIAEAVDEANARYLERVLRQQDPEGRCWRVERVRHPLYGTIVYYLVDPGCPALMRLVQELLEALKDYPVWDEQLLAEVEAERRAEER